MIEFDNMQATILLIDDEPESLESLARVLSAASYVCHLAQDSESATKIARANTPDLIISDINLAGHNGLTLCEQLKKEAGLGEVPLMFLSGAQIPDIIRRAHA